MPENSNYPKSAKKKANVLEEYITEKYGSVKKFQKSLKNEKRADLLDKIKDENWEFIIGKQDFFKRLLLGIKVCDALHIDFIELFRHENIIYIVPEKIPRSDKDSNLEETAENKYLTLDLQKKQKTIEFINNILAN
jgi:hypothetical protein